MSSKDLLIMSIIGGIFIILGIIAIIWGRKETGSWYSSISHRIDVREFLDRAPIRPEPVALKIGGVISLAVGVILLLIVLGLHLWG
jgi:hypothetical protein